MIVGERPGLVTAESLSAYLIYRPTLKSIEPEPHRDFETFIAAGFQSQRLRQNRRAARRTRSDCAPPAPHWRRKLTPAT